MPLFNGRCCFPLDASNLGNCVSLVSKRSAVGPAPADFEWGYEAHNGPSRWASMYSNARGRRQSPVDIETSAVIGKNEGQQFERPLSWAYYKDCCKILENTGESWKVTAEKSLSFLGVYGGPLEQKYTLHQFHCHWGQNFEGSEHAVNGKKYAAELHFVHWNSELYSSFKQASQSPHGLAVLAVFLKIGMRNEELDKITSQLKNVMYKGQRIKLKEGIDINALIPDDRSYWTYEGSLTTPPCYESVTWIVFQVPIQVSVDQVEKFRGLCCEAQTDSDIKVPFYCKRISDNCRPVQPLNNRVVKEALW